MTANFALPTLETAYATNYQAMVENIVAILKMDYTGATNIPDGAKRWSGTNSRFEVYDATAGTWGPLVSIYDIVVSGLSGLNATPAQINAICDPAVSNPPLTGDATSGRVVRTMQVKIENGTNANTVKARCVYRFNCEDITQVDNIPVNNTPTGGFACYDAIANNPYFYVKASALPGNCVAVLSATVVWNATGVHLLVTGTASSNDLRLAFACPPSAANIALATLVDTGFILVDVTYLTDA